MIAKIKSGLVVLLFTCCAGADEGVEPKVFVPGLGSASCEDVIASSPIANEGVLTEEYLSALSFFQGALSMYNILTITNNALYGTSYRPDVGGNFSAESSGRMLVATCLENPEEALAFASLQVISKMHDSGKATGDTE